MAEKLTRPQIDALRMIEKRDWPAGEPQISWFRMTTYAALVRGGLVEERFPNIVHLSPAGRAALALSKKDDGNG